MLNLFLILVGFYATLLSKDILNITNYKDYNLILCFIFLVTSFALIINNIIKAVSPSKLKIDKDLVKFIKDDELPLFNKNLYLDHEKQKASYIISLVSISFSLFSLINYVLTNGKFSLVFFLLAVIVSIPCIVGLVSPSYFLSFFSNRKVLGESNEK